MKRISVNRLARVEGNGGISATLDGNMVTDVKFSIFEGPRLVERLTLGKTPQEVVNVVPRICAICSLSHKYAAIRAMENALRIEAAPKVLLLRELMHLGEMIESHTLHLFYLALPDYVGFPNAIAMASEYDLEVKIALEMKEFGNHIMKTASGRYIHGENPVIGGFGKFPSREKLSWIKTRTMQFMPFVIKTVRIFCELDYPDCPEDETIFACCNPEQNKYGFAGDEIILSTGEVIGRDDYKCLTNEFIVSHSFAKRSRYKGKPYSVGALARITNLGERLTDKADEMYKKYHSPRWLKNPLFSNAAQALEILYAFERIPRVVDEILEHTTPPRVKNIAKEGQGTGIIEAPRGLLIHHYEITDGLVSHTDIITPTAQNAEDIERYCYIAAQKLLDNGQEEKIRDRMNLVVRAFDPCISCSVHMAEVRKAPTDAWKAKFNAIKEKSAPVFVGVGNRNHSDDGVGIKLALALRKIGVNDVCLESEIRQKKLPWQDSPHRPVIFIDAVDFGEKPGKITLVPLHYVLQNAALSHRFLPFISYQTSYAQLKNCFLLGIQPASIAESGIISKPVLLAMRKILTQMKRPDSYIVKPLMLT